MIRALAEALAIISFMTVLTVAYACGSTGAPEPQHHHNGSVR